MIWQSELVLYGLMILNGLVVVAFLLAAWRRGHLDDLERAADVLFVEDRLAKENPDEPS